MNELDHGNPTRLLLAAIRKSGIEGKGSLKGDDFYMGAFGDDKVHVYSFYSHIGYLLSCS